jgi:hypothetical protein
MAQRKKRITKRRYGRTKPGGRLKKIKYFTLNLKTGKFTEIKSPHKIP